MKKSDVKVGGVYAAKVSDKIAPVRIDAKNPHGGWDATNMKTKKRVRIKSAQRLRGPWPKKGTQKTTTSAPAAKKGTKATRKAKGTKNTTARDTGQRRGTSAKPKRLSILDAAVKVLEERDPADGPLSCKQMVERMAVKGYWEPRQGGKTPANTLYSAILREIKTKGEDSRFDKVERGKFALTLKGA